jgi:AAR2 protein
VLREQHYKNVPSHCEETLTTGLQSLHPYLTNFSPPPDDDKTTWNDLTSHITADLLNRVLRQDWTFTSHTSTTSEDTQTKLATLPSIQHESILNFTPIDLKRTFDPSAIGAERTKQILDKSYYLENLLEELPDDLVLLGELQLAFLAVLYMNNFSGFESWKNIFTVLCGCREALRPKEMLFQGFLRGLRQQFDMCSEETFNEVILEGNFVADNLKVTDIIRFLSWNICTNIYRRCNRTWMI